MNQQQLQDFLVAELSQSSKGFRELMDFNELRRLIVGWDADRGRDRNRGRERGSGGGEDVGANADVTDARTALEPPNRTTSDSTSSYSSSKQSKSQPPQERSDKRTTTSGTTSSSSTTTATTTSSSVSEEGSSSSGNAAFLDFMQLYYTTVLTEVEAAAESFAQQRGPAFADYLAGRKATNEGNLRHR
jgi:hypothetical protein